MASSFFLKDNIDPDHWQQSAVGQDQPLYEAGPQLPMARSTPSRHPDPPGARPTTRGPTWLGPPSAATRSDAEDVGGDRPVSGGQGWERGNRIGLALLNEKKLKKGQDIATFCQ